MPSFLLLFFVLIVAWTQAEENECPAGVCNACHVLGPAARGNIYQNGGSAQAYKPHQPEKDTVCDDNHLESSSRVAWWPFWRSTQTPAAMWNITLHLWTCPDENACCKALKGRTPLVEIWQARPDGTYASLRPGHEDGDCRARQQTTTPSISFRTVAPGSTGSLGGLGPGGWDFMPYGPPTWHVLVTEPTLEPLLVDVRPTTSFWGPDWRGVAWMRQRTTGAAYEITEWNEVEKDKRKSVNIQMNLFLRERAVENADQHQDPIKNLCKAWLYGLPSSFFLEPITLCAPSMLDFFAL